MTEAGQTNGGHGSPVGVHGLLEALLHRRRDGADGAGLRAAGETDAAFDLAEQAFEWCAGAGGGDGAELADEALAELRAEVAEVAGGASGPAADGDRHAPVAQ